MYFSHTYSFIALLRSTPPLPLPTLGLFLLLFAFFFFYKLPGPIHASYILTAIEPLTDTWSNYEGS